MEASIFHWNVLFYECCLGYKGINTQSTTGGFHSFGKKQKRWQHMKK